MAETKALAHSGPYRADGCQIAFPFDFAVNDEQGLIVEVNGAAVASSIYSVSMADNDRGGAVTFISPPTNGDTILLRVVSKIPQPIPADGSNVRAGRSRGDGVDRRGAVRKLFLLSSLLPVPFAARTAAGSVRLPAEGLNTQGSSPGPRVTSTQNDIFVSLADFRAAPISNQRQTLKVPDIPFGEFYFETDNAPYIPDNVNTIKADSTPLSVGAWVRQNAAGINFDGRSVAAKLHDVVSVKDARFAGGAKGDGKTDDRAAIQAAFDSGAACVIFPTGVYRCNAGLTVPNWLHIRGEGFQPGIGPGLGAVVLRFTQTDGIALSCGHNPVIENIVLWNSGGFYDDASKALSRTTAIGISLIDNATIGHCSFHLWHTCIRLGAESYYFESNGLEFNRCTNGYKTNGSGPVNVHINHPVSRDTTYFFVGETAFATRNVKIIGGSIEGYSCVASGVLDISVFGTYFETIRQRAGAYGIDPRVKGASVSLFGCVIYMDHTARFLNLAGVTDAMLASHGNVFDGIAPPGAICLHLPPSGSVTLGGDKFGFSHPNDAVYVDSITSAMRFHVTMPVLPNANSQAAYSGIRIIGPQGYVMAGLTTEPNAKVVGQTVMADGGSWDPLNRRIGRPYWVVWQGDRWQSTGG